MKAFGHRLQALRRRPLMCRWTGMMIVSSMFFGEGNSVKALDSFSVVEVAVVADVSLCVSCAGAHAEFVCSECELREVLGHLLELAYGVATCPSGKVGRRWLARIKQMVSAELVARVCSEGSPTFLATFSEIQLCLMA